jgi:hypothetical protein
MLRKLALGLLVGGILTLSVAAGAFAAGNPNGTGQPSQSCGSATASTSPNGFNTAGFTNAGGVYAGSKGTASAANANSSAAVSQYDVACYQVTTHH